MGQACFPSEENEERITELESLLKKRELEKEQLKKKLLAQKQKQKTTSKHKKTTAAEADKVQQISNQKKSTNIQLRKARTDVSKLQETIHEYKTQINEMEQAVDTLKKEKEKAKKRAEKAEQNNKTLTQTYSEPVPAGKLPKLPQNSQSVTRRPSFTIGSVIANLPGFKQPTPVAPPFVIKHKTKPRNKSMSSDDENRTTDGGSDESTSSDDDSYQVLEMKDTILLDVGYDANSEATHVHSWLHGQKIDSKKAVKQLKHRLASMLTSRSEGYRQTLIQAYRAQYGLNLEKDINKIIVKGHALEIIHGLLMTRAQYDAILISECVANWDIEPVADIICCRSMFQLQELHDAYKKKCKLDVKKQLQALAQKDKKKTLVKVIGGIFDLHRKELADVDMNAVNSDLNFVLTTKNFKGETKERLVMVFTVNSVQYIKVLNDQFKLKSKDSLTVFMDKKLGPKSTAGYFCKTRILYALDTPDYYAQKIQMLGKRYKKNQKKIADIFIQRMETDLELVKRSWAMHKYGDGKDLKTWIVAKTGSSKSGYFLVKMLDNCGRYTEFRKNDETKPKSKFEQMMMGN